MLATVTPVTKPPPAILRSEVEGVALNLACMASEALHPDRPTVADEALIGVVATLRRAGGAQFGFVVGMVAAGAQQCRQRAAGTGAIGNDAFGVAGQACSVVAQPAHRRLLAIIRQGKGVRHFLLVLRRRLGQALRAHTTGLRG